LIFCEKIPKIMYRNAPFFIAFVAFAALRLIKKEEKDEGESEQ